MKKNKTHIVILLDRSGSMSNIWEQCIAGANSFIKDQQNIKDGETVASIFAFDDFRKPIVENALIQSVKPLSANDRAYSPNGNTALYDSLCTTIDEVGLYFSKLPLSERPEKVMFLTVSDGFENASRIFKKEDVKSRITHQTDVYNWDFSYIGADKKAMLDAESFGISAGKALFFTASEEGATGAFASASNYAVRSRSMNALQMKSNSYSKEEQEQALAKTKTTTKA